MQSTKATYEVPPIFSPLLKKAKDFETPFLLFSTKLLQEKIERFKASFGPISVNYSLKANSEPSVLRVIDGFDCNFDIASKGDIDILSKFLKVNGRRMHFSNPIKKPEDIAAASAAGVKKYCVDSINEVNKISKIAPKAEVYVRLAVANTGAAWPLSNKYGVDEAYAGNILRYAKEVGLTPIGATFHVGSQNSRKESWKDALLQVKTLFENARKAGINLYYINMGGGFPVSYLHEVEPIETYGAYIQGTVKSLFPNFEDLEMVIEPGRSLVAEAGLLVTTIIGSSKRGSKNWLFTDVGIFNGLMEAYEDFHYPIATDRDGKLIKYAISGPTCDSVDIVHSGTWLPKMEVGDKLYFREAGAYTVSYVRYNGFEFPPLFTEKVLSFTEKVLKKKTQKVEG